MNLLTAIDEISRLPDSRISVVSPFYETSPVGVNDQPFFLNAVLRLATGLAPHDLFTHLQQIENAVFARTRTVRWGPRTIDLDLLLYGNAVINEDSLIVPHPAMTERRFVLQPLSDIAPDLAHPVSGRCVAELLAGLRSDEIVTKISERYIP